MMIPLNIIIIILMNIFINHVLLFIMQMKKIKNYLKNMVFQLNISMLQIV